MGLYRGFLLIAAILLVAVVDSTPVEVPASARALESGTPATKFLRTDTTGEEEEVRGPNFGFSSLKTLVNSLKPTKRNQLAQLLKSHQSTDDAFAFLKLDAVGDQILTNPAFNVWRKYVSKISGWNADDVVMTNCRSSTETLSLQSCSK
ncbi:hypothetical protein PHYSODRAFT_289133 [Phytophthora sojae]|uniref:RxLR effector protein n=2 Tax=Phytophthora sojae TaxID=67593 RepID=G5ADV7_PHYSP|nr:hypothetical protein PHYSODRAFT_289133 [Phytophthora sojae]AEK81137.1 Avh306 [Phytophthora sojae]AEK81138.1 Avh306 [Phytophthora sojae]AEK81139.1 Avh306 [Phytophthora sojae]EGZ06359.1 hypothetical protein PHYSODRAFT_289133 [Phytophthora sojae]|eukprot:XP_009538256.1 hypothetical protein PHYSODRAFT_289133 [Phytophthora sojae]